jgi:hypothetical protein
MVLTWSSAQAAPAPLVTDVEAASSAMGCSLRSVTVVRWTPAQGPAARFVVQHAFRGGQGTLIGLGVTDEGLWSTQDTIPDGCGAECATIDLVFTRFADGRSTRHPLWGDADVRAVLAHPETAAAQREQAVRRRLWAYAGTVWPAGSMRQDYALITPASKGSDDGAPPPYAGWLAAVVRGGRWSLRLTTKLSQTMCWCSSTWTSVARPSP